MRLFFCNLHWRCACFVTEKGRLKLHFGCSLHKLGLSVACEQTQSGHSLRIVWKCLVRNNSNIIRMCLGEFYMFISTVKLLSWQAEYVFCVLLPILQKENDNILTNLVWKLFVWRLSPSIWIISFCWGSLEPMCFLSTDIRPFSKICFTAILRSLQPVAVSRQDPDSRKNTVAEITRRALSRDQWPQVINTNTNKYTSNFYHVFLFPAHCASQYRKWPAG